MVIKKIFDAKVAMIDSNIRKCTYLTAVEEYSKKKGIIKINHEKQLECLKQNLTMLESFKAADMVDIGRFKQEFL